MKINKLEDIIDAVEFQSDESSSFINIKNGKIYTISEYEFMLAEEDEGIDDLADWEQENVQIAKQILESNEYLSLPGKFDLDEYRLMEKFSLSITEEAISTDLYNSIKGSGAFRRFKNKIYEFGLETKWYTYRDQNIKETVKNWCIQNNVKFVQ